MHITGGFDDVGYDEAMQRPHGCPKLATWESHGSTCPCDSWYELAPRHRHTIAEDTPRSTQLKVLDQSATHLHAPFHGLEPLTS
jgi:hypothetical protein